MNDASRTFGGNMFWGMPSLNPVVYLSNVIGVQLPSLPPMYLHARFAIEIGKRRIAKSITINY